MLDLAWEWSRGRRRGERRDVLSRLPAGWGTRWRPSLCLSANTYFSPSRSSGSPVCACVCVVGEEGHMQVFIQEEEHFIVDYISNVHFAFGVTV